MRRYEAGQEVVSGVKIISHIGAGGFGTVYKVSVPGGVEKALKIINLQGTQGVKEYNALKLIKKISHPNLVSIDSYWLRDLQGKLIDFSSDDSINAEKQSLELIILMGLGRMSLHDMLMQYINQGKQGIPFDELIRLISATAEAIDYLNEPHDLGLKERVAIQHGDIKPGNILLVGNSVQVCDYGLAKAITNSKGVRTSVALFSPGYCSPEMNRNQPSYWSDQFSLAISYYELRTGKLPFNEEEEINAGIVAALGKLDFSGVPKAEREVLLKAANPIPNQRYPKCMDMINALRATAYSSPRDSGPKPRTLDEVLQPESDIVPGYKLVQRISQGERDEFWKAITSAGKPFIIYVIREFRGALGNQLLQSLEFLRQLDEHENLINLRNSWMIHSDGRVMPYIDAGSLENQTVALVSLLDNVDCTLEDYYNECLKKRASQGIPDHELLQFMMQTGKAVDYLTQLGHTDYLDLKPQTILLTKNKTVKLGIAGLAKRLMSGSSALTTDRLVNAFAPPELFDFEVGKHWNSNQYSLALTYYWLRSLGHLPFPADSSPKQIREYHLHGQLDFTDVPEREQNILYNATVLDPNQRFASCFEFVDAMQVAMGVSVPQYAAVPSQQKLTPRPTPLRSDQPTPSRPSLEERPTNHQERQQQITPAIIPQQKTPQTPAARRSDPYSTISSMQALPMGYGYDETTEHTPYSEASQQVAGLHQQEFRAESQGLIENGEEPEQDYRSVFRQTSVEKKKKRRRAAMIITVGGLLFSVVGALAFWKFVLDKPGTVTINSSSIAEPTDAKPIKTTQPTTPVPLTPEQLARQIDDLVDKKEYRAALAQIDQARQPTNWVREQRSKVRNKLSSSLDAVIKTYLEAKDFPKAKEIVTGLAKEHEGILPDDWKNKWNDVISKIEYGSKSSTWVVDWSNAKSKLKGLASVKQLREYQGELLKLAADAPDDQKPSVKSLLDSVQSFVALNGQTVGKDPEALLARLKQFDDWSNKADKELLAAGWVKEVLREILKDAKEGYLKVETKDSLLRYSPVMKLLRSEDDKENSDWIIAARLEIAAQDASTITNEIKQLAEVYTPQSPLGQFAKAACLSQEMNGEAIKRWMEVFPEGKERDRALSYLFRVELAEKRIDGLLDQCRVPGSKGCAFVNDATKQQLALNAVKLLLVLSSANRADALLLAERAILEDAVTSGNQGKALKAFRATAEYQKLGDVHKTEVLKVLGSYPMDNSTPLPDRLRMTSEKLKALKIGSGDTIKIPAAMVKDVITPLADCLEQFDIAAASPEEKREIAKVCTAIGSDIALNLNAWQPHFKSERDALALSTRMLKAARTASDNDPVSSAILMVFSRFNRNESNLTPAELKSLEAAVENTNDVYLNLCKCYLMNTSMEMTAGDATKQKLYETLLGDNSAQIDKTIALLNGNNYLANRFKCRLMLQNSNLMLRKAHYGKSDMQKNKLLSDALTLVNDVDQKFAYDKERVADMKGIILEDQAMLLKKPTYPLAVKEFEKALGSEGFNLRTKAQLHMARCKYRWGALLREENNASESEKQLQSSIRDMNDYLKEGADTPLLQIEANFFKGLANLELALSFIASDKAKASNYWKLGSDSLDSALAISAEKDIHVFTNIILFEYIVKTVKFATEIRNKVHLGVYKDYSKDSDYKKCIEALEILAAKFSNLLDYVNYIRFCLIYYKNDINEKNIDSSDIQPLIQKANEYSSKCIAEAKARNNTILLVEALENDYKRYLPAKDYESAFKASQQLSDVLESSHYPDAVKALWLVRTARLAWPIYIKDKDNKKTYKDVAVHSLVKVMDHYHLCLDSDNPELAKSQMIDNMKTVFKNFDDAEKKEWTTKLKLIESNAKQSQNPNNVVTELLEAIAS